MTAPSAADDPPPQLRRPKQRGVELSLLVGAVLIVVSGYVDVGLARNGAVPPGRPASRRRARPARPPRPPRGPLPRPVRRPLAAADRGAAQRARPGADLPARPGDAGQPGSPRPAGLVDARGRPVPRRRPGPARPPRPCALRLPLGGRRARPDAGADLLPGGQRRQDLDQAGRLLLPARGVREDPARRLLRRLPRGQPQRAGLRRAHGSGGSNCPPAGCSARSWRSGC